MQFGTEKGIKIDIGRAHKLVSAKTPKKESSDSVIEDSRCSLTLTPDIGHCEAGEGYWLQGEAALQEHSFRDADPQPVE